MMLGKRPKHPATVNERLKQPTRESEACVRLIRHVGFDLSDPLVEDAIAPTQENELPTQYDEAMEVIRWVAGATLPGPVNNSPGPHGEKARL